MAAVRKPRLKARVALERDGRILCVLHAKPEQAPFWCLPGGNVDDGESLAAAAVRELREEVGADVRLDGAILIVDGPRAGAVEVILRGALDGGEPAIGADSGDPYLAELAWLPRASLPVDFHPAPLRALLASAPLADLPAIAVADWTP